MLVTSMFYFLTMFSMLLQVAAIISATFQSLPNDKSLDLAKLKGFADDKIIFAKMMIYVVDRAENVVGKGENGGYQHYL